MGINGDSTTNFEIGDDDANLNGPGPNNSDYTNLIPRQPNLPQSDSATSGYQQERPGYAELNSNSDDENLNSTNPRLGQSELDPLKYPPPPPGYYRQDVPLRITHYGKLFLVLIAMGLACLCIAALIDVSSPSTRFEPGRDKQSVADNVLAAMDRSADPCDNFYEYACGSWLRSASLPSDRSQYTKSFSVVYDRIQLMVKELLENDFQTTADGPASKPGIFYASCIDQMGTGGLNTLYLAPFRDQFSSLKDGTSFARILGKLHRRSATALFDVDVSVDEKNPTQYILYLGQGGLGLPHRDNYLSMKDVDVEMRQKYLVLLQTILGAAGKARLIPRQGHDVLARDVLEFEKLLANASMPPQELRDPEKVYNKVVVDKLPDDFHMPEYLSSLGVDSNSSNGTLVIDNVNFFQTLARVMSKLSTEAGLRQVVRGYLAFHLARSAASEGLLGETMYHETFKFKQHVYGLKQLPEQWKFCQTLTNIYMGEAVGAGFVKKHFSESRKKVATHLAREISNAFSESLKSEEWMDDATKQAAVEKLNEINWKVGYSEKLDSYDDVEVTQDSFQSNVAATLEHEWNKKLGRLGKPIDKTQWFMKPQEVNAYYSPTRNEIVFPAGILQPPFFSDAFPDAINYGGIGAVVGHEMSHGFDDQGRKYDKYGKLTSWWSSSSAAHYEEKAKCFVDLYDTYKPRDVDIHVLGNLTLGENLADTNGVNVAYRAFKRSPNNTEDGIPPPNVLLARELTNDQLFFVAYAQTWCTLYRQEALKVQMMTDPHSPGQFRVRGPLSQNDAFAKAFNCRNGSRYNPESKCHLW